MSRFVSQRKYARRVSAGVVALVLAGCAVMPEGSPGRQREAARPADAAGSHARDLELERRIARIELQLWERDAVIEDLQERLDSAREEVVRAMAKLQTLATRAEAASAMAEADLAIQSLKAAGRDVPVTREAARLVQQSGAAFAANNYGGSLYLANQAKAMASQARRVAGSELAGMRARETPFAAPVPLRAAARGNVRDGPGAGHGILYVVEPAGALTGLSYLGDWVRVMDGAGREGWIARALVARREPAR